jgi:hypothetical protein
MKKLLLAAALILFICAVADCQMVNQNTQFTKVAMFSGKPVIQDTSLLIKSGNDTIRITSYADTSRISTTAGGGIYLAANILTNKLKSIGGFKADSANFRLNCGVDTFEVPFLGLQYISSAGASAYDGPNGWKYGNYITQYNSYYLAGVSATHPQTFRVTQLIVKGDTFQLQTGSIIPGSTPRANIEGIDSTIKIQSTYLEIGIPSIGSGKVLTSDALGMATWEASSRVSADSATIYALTPTPGTQYYCNNCTGGGITGRVVYYAGSAWRRIPIE